MSFGLNTAQLIGRLGADITASTTGTGRQVANITIATDEGYVDLNSGEVVDRVEWHRVATFQDGVVEMLKRQGRKGRLVYIAGKLQTRRWRKPDEDSDRFTTEILIAPGGRVQFLEKLPTGAPETATTAPADADIPY